MGQPRIVRAERLGEIEAAEVRLPATGIFSTLTLPELELLYVAQGTLQLVAGAVRRTARPGDVIVRRVNAAVSIAARTDALVMTLRIPRFLRGQDTYSSLGSAAIRLIRGAALTAAFRRAHEQFTSRHANRVVLEALCLMTIGLALPLDDEAIHEQYGWFQPVLSRIGTLDQTITTRELANLAGVSPSHLSRVFRELKGCSVAAYQRQLRIAEACRLMREPQLSLTRIARMSGYSDQSHFSNAFRRQVGCSPRDFRRRLDTMASSGRSAATFDVAGEYRFWSHTADGRPYDGTLTISGSPWAYEGVVRTTVMPDVPIESVAIAGDVVVVTGRVPAGLAVLHLRMRGEAFVGDWKLASGGRPLAGHRHRPS